MKKMIVLAFCLLVIMFVALSIFHAYSFTHPTKRYFEIKREGMNIAPLNLFLASFIGIRPIRHFPLQTPEDYNLSYENITFKSTDRLLIKGWLIKHPAPKGTIIFAHGYNANRGKLEVAAFFNWAGFSVLMFDFRGHGESEGDYISMGYHESKDILGAIIFLSQREDVNLDYLYGFGQSMGAAALIFAQEQKPSFDGLILESTYPDLHQNIATRFKRTYGLPKFPFATSMTLFGSLILGVNSFSTSPINSIPKVRMPVFLIHDLSDNSVSLENAWDLYNAANEPKKLWIVENASHTGAYTAAEEEFERRVLSFLES